MSESGHESTVGKAAMHAALVTLGYFLSGMAWFILLDGWGRFKDSEVSADVAWRVVPVTAILVFPCSFVPAGILFKLFPLKSEWRRPWRAWLAGLVAAPAIFSPWGEGVVAFAERWVCSLLPLESQIGWFLIFLSPIHLMVGAGLALSWAVPPWRASRLP